MFRLKKEAGVSRQTVCAIYGTGGVASTTALASWVLI